MPQGTQTETEQVVVDDPNRAATEETVAGKLAEVFKDGDEELVIAEPGRVEPEPTGTATTPAAEKAEETPDAEKEEPEAAAEGSAEKPTTPAKPASAPEIPAAYRRSLKSYQWTDEEIDANATRDPAAFLKMAEKVHLNRVQETQRWAEMGRQTKSAAPPAKTVEAPKFDAAALRAKYGNEPFIDAMEAQNAALTNAWTFIEAAQQRQQQAEIESLTKTVDGYFGDKSMEPYHDLYGKAGTTLTDSQVGSRQKVLETAELLINGAAKMGRPMTLDEALTMAHDSLASPIAAKVAVKKIETQVQTRAKALTLRPGGRTPNPKQGEDRVALEAQVGKGLAKAFGKKV